ncbi:MAG: hypothetical protein ACRDWH_10825 [Acidimicrobiia bacterium]
MSFHRFMYLCGWTAVILLTIAGFAAFSADNTADATRAANLGRPIWGEAAGAVSAQGWFALAGSRATAAVVAEPAESSTASTVPRNEQTTSSLLDTGWLDSLSVRNLVETYFGSGDVNRAVRLAWCVSRFDIDAINPTTGATGLFQVDPELWAIATAEMGLVNPDPFDPATNVAVAAHIVYQGDGWAAWDCL